MSSYRLVIPRGAVFACYDILQPHKISVSLNYQLAVPATRFCTVFLTIF
jgi:hypothetical protein